jgi:hypothetical protein
MMSQIAKIDKAEIFLPEEERVLKKTLSIREQIVDELLKDGVPTKVGEIRVINELLNSMDSQVLSKVDRRLKKDENDNNENVVEIIANIVRNVEDMKKYVDVQEVERQIELTEGLKPDEIVLGEDQIEYEELDLEQFQD